MSREIRFMTEREQQEYDDERSVRDALYGPQTRSRTVRVCEPILVHSPSLEEWDEVTCMFHDEMQREHWWWMDWDSISWPFSIHSVGMSQWERDNRRILGVA